MQLTPDVVQEANISDKEIMKMESTTDMDSVEASMDGGMELTSNEDLLGGNAKDAMVAIPGHYLNKEIKNGNEISALTKDLLSGYAHFIENDEGDKNGELKNEVSTQATVDGLDNSRVPSGEHSETTTEDLVDSSKLFNGSVKLGPQNESLKDSDMPDSLPDSQFEKVQDVPSDACTKNDKLVNGIIVPVKSEIVSGLDSVAVVETGVPEISENSIDSNHASEATTPASVVNSIKEEWGSDEIGYAKVVKTEIENVSVDVEENTDNEKANKYTECLKTDIPDGDSKKIEDSASIKCKEESDTNVVELKVVNVAENKPVDITEPKSTNSNSENKSDNIDAAKAMDVDEKPFDSEVPNNKSESGDSAKIITPTVIDTFNLDSDDEMDGKTADKPTSDVLPMNNEVKECVSVNLDDDDDDDIMLVDDTPKETTATINQKENNDQARNGAVTPTLNKDLPKSSIPAVSDLTKDNDKLAEKVDLDDDDIVLVNEEKSASDTDISKDKVNNSKSNEKCLTDLQKPKSPSPEMDKKQEPDGKTKSLPEETTDAINVKKDENEPVIPLVPLEIKISIKNNIEKMNREDLEEFCLVKVVEAIIARSNLSDLRLTLKMLQKNIEEWRKKLNDLTKQNKDLDTVVRSVIDLQKRNDKERPVPIKITRSVGLQVGFTCNPSLSKTIDTAKPNASSITTVKKGRPSKVAPKPQTQNTPSASPIRSSPAQTVQKKTTPIPVPRIVAANKSPAKGVPQPVMPSPVTPIVPTNSQPIKNVTPNSVGDNRRQSAEKRPAAFQSIDLTDDEPPSKQPDLRSIQTKFNVTSAIKPGNRPVAPTAPTAPVVPAKPAPPGNRIGIIGNIPTSRPVNYQRHNNIGPNMTMFTPRKIMPIGMNRPHSFVRIPGNSQQPIRMGTSMPIMPTPPMRHPAPLPQTPVPKQTSHPTWKWIPPRPNLKIAKADNGIVISWEMEGFVDSRHEEVASYQIYAYQETSTPPNTDLWKKIGDVKSLPLPMACTLTKFMAGFKYYFAVRAVDIRSRVGPFSAPGQILLLNDK